MHSVEYSDLIQRNIGLLTDKQQYLLKNSSVAIFGLGGLGGVIAEIFVRCGICSFKIADNDKFEPTNLNRQIFAFRDTVGKFKTDVTEKFLKRINPEIKVEKFTEISTGNIGQILKGINCAILAVDSAKPCLIICRAAKQINIPVIEGWALPFGNVRVFTGNSPSLEEVYNFPTVGKDIDAISEEEYKNFKLYMLSTLKEIEGVDEFYPTLAVERIKQGKIPSFAPLVWLTAVLMSLETIKVILNLGKISVSPDFALYNPFNNSIPKQKD